MDNSCKCTAEELIKSIGIKFNLKGRLDAVEAIYDDKIAAEDAAAENLLRMNYRALHQGEDVVVNLDVEMLDILALQGEVNKNLKDEEKIRIYEEFIQHREKNLCIFEDMITKEQISYYKNFFEEYPEFIKNHIHCSSRHNMAAYINVCLNEYNLLLLEDSTKK